MKCLCGYTFEEEFDEEDRNNKIILGDKDFIKIKGSFTIEKDYDRLKEVRLFACPKCNTVQMMEW